MTGMAGVGFCEECGHPLREGAQFCASCGHPVSTAGAAVAAASEPSAPPGPPSAPPGPPPGGPPPVVPVGPSAGGSGSGGDRNQKVIIGLLAALVLAVVAVAVVLVVGGGGGEEEPASKKDREVLLESTASAGPAPFTPDLQPVAATTPTTMTPVTTGVPPTTVAGPSGRVAQGPFGGTGDNSLCDRELLVEFLTTPANAAIAREWARVLDIRVEDIPTYVRALIPTTLTGDTRVTNHRWENGRAVGYQAVLERGTAVLVDVDGRLIARCRCGNPLLPPQEIAQPVYTGPKWDGFDPTVIVVVVPSPTPIYPPGGVGTLPQGTVPTTPTTRGTTTTTRGTTSSTVPDDIAAEAISLVRGPLEVCLRTEYAKYGFDPEETIGELRYAASMLDLRTGMFRVVVSNLEGESATWDVSLRTGDVTPVDANAQETIAYCPALA